MLYSLLVPLAEYFQPFNLFRYITFRAGGAVITSLLICWIIGPRLIAWLKARQNGGQPILSYLEETHGKKKGTPTMGGLMMLIAILVSTLLWMELNNPYVWIALFVTVGFGAIGAIDDYNKLTTGKNHMGLPARVRLAAEFLIAAAAVYALTLITKESLATTLAFPFFKDLLIDLGPLFILFGVLVIAGSANAVNITDGLDGLATVPVMIAASCFMLFAYLVGNVKFAEYLQLHYVAGTGELMIFMGAVVGSCLGFLWFNCQPAEVFMGDTGSLALGGALGITAVTTKHEIVLALVGGLFVAETLSVVLQVGSYKLRGKRIFLMAPLHHHFEKKGWSESKIVIRFWIVSLVLALLALSTLKLR
jgi:phospho-N-acetylmuramoyl-pentapeptide-transferase